MSGLDWFLGICLVWFGLVFFLLYIIVRAFHPMCVFIVACKYKNKQIYIL
jgi:hypothetical protein